MKAYMLIEIETGVSEPETNGVLTDREIEQRYERHQKVAAEVAEKIAELAGMAGRSHHRPVVIDWVMLGTPPGEWLDLKEGEWKERVVEERNLDRASVGSNHRGRGGRSRAGRQDRRP